MNKDDIELWRQLFFVIVNGLNAEIATEDEKAQAVTVFWNLIGNGLTPKALEAFVSASEIIKTEATLEKAWEAK